MLNRIVKTAALSVGGYLLARQLLQRLNQLDRPLNQLDRPARRSVVEFIEVNVPVGNAYNQWTQFEDFPKFMAGVEEVRQIDEKTLHWCVLVDGKREEWDAEITEQIPDERIAWHSVGGADNAGVVTFHKITDERSRVTLQLDYTPQTLLEKVGDTVLHAVESEAKNSLQSFKTFIESRGGVETGAWRGAATQW